MTETQSGRKALIVGCGVAGPVLAMFLQRVGITPVIYEGRPEPRDEAGFFLNLAANGTDVLATLGLEDDILELGHRTDSLVFQNHDEKRLGENPTPTTLVKRGLLTKTLREAAIDRGVTVEFGKRLTDVETPNDDVAIAYFDDGTEAHGDFLIGCDGIHSRTRRSILPSAPDPEYTGIVDSGAFARNDSIPDSDGVMRMTFGVDGFFGYQKVPAGEIYWFENHERSPEPDRAALDAISTDEWRAELLERHRDDHDSVAEIIRSTDGEIGRWPIYDLPSLPAWHRKSACLVGDAAHATSPHVGQGASLAMEDAIVLTKCLRDVGDVPAAFEAFEQLRKKRVEDIVEMSRRTGNQKAPSNAVTRKVRDLVLPFFLKRGVEEFDQIYSYRVDWDEPVSVRS
ncbi:FAD-dependent oxidoreductase [Halorussus amylolyticus]|uniref:FAD-dependent oxidoreductase n=1 Tax=Halorussus amylolyticus TaxID=1126242 RepID=UPI00192FAD25|nr:NAD(P)/FAD-dependent oxidoreductase [Halorussus amylolyticus]